jgi:uncharacterized RDD family membrane protein YckC
MGQQPPYQPPPGGPPPGGQPPPPGGYQPQQPPGQYPGPYQQMAPVSPQGRPLAEWWKRAVAIIIDSLILGIPGYIIIAILGVGFASQAEIDPVTGELEGGAGFFAGFLISALAFAVISVLYFVFLNGGEKGQTVGKMVMKIQVRDEATGGAIGYGKGFLRWLVAYLLGALCFIGSLVDLLFPLWDPKRQCIHDKAVNSLVIDLS